MKRSGRGAGNTEISVNLHSTQYREKNEIISDIMTQMSQQIISRISPCRSACASEATSEEELGEDKTRQIEKERDIMQMGLPRELCCRNCSARSTHAPAAARSGPTTFLPGHLSLRYPSNGSKKELIRGGR